MSPRETDQQYSRDFPILSYILSKLDPKSNPPLSPQLQETLLTQLPHLNHPKVLASMTHLIPTTLSQTLSLLRALGTPPDPSTVVVARAKIAEIQSKLQNSSSSALQEAQNYSQVREAAEKELEICKAVVRLEELHETYEEQLRDVEVRLAEAYGSVVVDLEKEEGEVIKLNEEVIRILKEAESGVAVERAELSGRHLRFLPEAFGKLHGLVSLNLSNNQLQSIPDSIAGLEKLEELHVSSNLLVSLPDSLGLLLNLRILNVSGNKLDALPESIARCSSLVELDASFNNLMCLPTNIGYGLLNLERLSIHLNKIRSLPPSICEMRSLRYLDVHFNQLRGLPHAIGRLTTLEVLNLSSNFSDLTELPESIGDQTNLRELDLRASCAYFVVCAHFYVWVFGFSEVFAECEKEIGALAKRLLGLISQGLGPEEDCLQKKLGENPTQKAEGNYYPPCPDPELTLGLSVHTDLNALTILRQTEGVTGLQVLIKDEKWVAVDPVPIASVINLGFE